jgi:hypothetical protein
MVAYTKPALVWSTSPAKAAGCILSCAQPTARLKCPCSLETVKELVGSIFQAAESRATQRALDGHARALAQGRKGASMLVYLASNLADDAVLTRILWDDTAQAAAVASMAAFRAIVEDHHTKYFSKLKTAPMYLKLIPVRFLKGDIHQTPVPCLIDLPAVSHTCAFARGGREHRQLTMY